MPEESTVSGSLGWLGIDVKEIDPRDEQIKNLEMCVKQLEASVERMDALLQAMKYRMDESC